MANSEWVLGVHIQHFEYLYNVEIRDGLYCCCDISYTIVDCVEDLNDLNVAACISECEPYFETHFEVCITNGACSYIKSETTSINNILGTCISPLFVQLHSNKSMIDNITMNDNIIKVSAKKAGTHIRIYIYMCVWGGGGGGGMCGYVYLSVMVCMHVPYFLE